MPQIGLALSGGGFRATLYHLGVVRYLRDTGLLADVADIASVSGGSVLAAHMVLNWHRYCGDDAAFAEAAAELIRFVQFDVRNHVVRRLPLLFLPRLVAKTIGWHAPGLTPNAVLERAYARFLFGDRRLFELPERPALHVLSTNVSDGVMAVFNRTGLHIQRRIHDGGEPFRLVPGQMTTVAKAVSASSAFPGFFPPVEITAADLGVHEGQFAPESFTDGGVYDNLGTRAFAWLKRFPGHADEQVLVSDAGKPFQVIGNAPLGFIAQSIRASDILWDRVWQLERENFGDRNGFYFLPITEVVDPHEDPHALHPLVQAEISSIRTDLDRFSALEIDALVAHGYEVTRAAHRRVAALAHRPVVEGLSWQPFPQRSLPAVDTGSHPLPAGTARTTATSVHARLAARLRRSGQRKVWSTLLAWRDWPTYVYLLAAAVLLVWLPIHVLRLHHRAVMLTSLIDSIAEGDPDIRLVLDLVERDPVAGWQRLDITPAAAATPGDFSGIDILSYSRIVDMRSAFMKPGPGLAGRLRVRERVNLKLSADAIARGELVFRSMLPTSEIEYRVPPGQLPVTARKVPDATGGGSHYELHVDVRQATPGTMVTFEVVVAFRYAGLAEERLPLILQFPTELLTVWLLFPEDHPYTRYELLRAPAANPTAFVPLAARYTIDHPYGQLIGWSVIGPEQGGVYECRWRSR